MTKYDIMNKSKYAAGAFSAIHILSFVLCNS